MTDSQLQPHTFNLAHLLCNDPNPLPSYDDTNKEAVLASTARQCAQSLINQLLTTCPISRSTDDGNLQITLPAPSTEPGMMLPREKSVPKEKEKTKWEKFAAKKGIQGKKRDGNLRYDEEKGDWVKKHGYKGKDASGGDWLVEVDEKKEKAKREEGKQKRVRKTV